MYNRFFGFKERPFKLVPNPEFLYLSRIHEEVLAHLNYAVEYGEGFVEITGEVGTGKTTLCRMFLENLKENTEAAYIFNPKLDVLQLLKAINDEFGIESDTDSVKTLIDRLNAFLLEQKAQGKRVILLIDEAQNLSVEVLEQLRLLSNLETMTSKLLQIILVGQPELGELLESGTLRQLNQRITLSCHLVPLSAVETREYIRHRIHIASQNPGLEFTSSAHRSIFRYSSGIPRLINIVCDRALLAAYSRNKTRITNRIVKQALRELDSKGYRNAKPMLLREKLTLGLLSLLVFLVAGMVASQTLVGPASRMAAPVVHHKIEKQPVAERVNERPETKVAPTEEDAGPVTASASVPPPQPPAQTPEAEATVQRTQMPEPEVAAAAEPQRVPEPALPTQDRDVNRGFAFAEPMHSRAGALAAVLSAWNAKMPAGPVAVLDSDTYFRLSARYSNMEIIQVKGSLNLLRKLNLPAIVEIPYPEGIRFLALTGLGEEEVQLSDGEKGYSLAPEAFASMWNGKAHIFWKNHFNYTGVIPINSPGEVILSLKGHLKTLGYSIGAMDTTYDAVTQRAIETIQASNGLDVDGMVGPQTKIVLYNEDRSLVIPRLSGS